MADAAASFQVSPDLGITILSATANRKTKVTVKDVVDNSSR
ncbi:hypothetical protein V1498_18910 [Peribacillus sp. SCS-26]